MEIRKGSSIVLLLAVAVVALAIMRSGNQPPVEQRETTPAVADESQPPAAPMIEPPPYVEDDALKASAAHAAAVSARIDPIESVRNADKEAARAFIKAERPHVPVARRDTLACQTREILLATAKLYQSGNAAGAIANSLVGCIVIPAGSRGSSVSYDNGDGTISFTPVTGGPDLIAAASLFDFEEEAPDKKLGKHKLLAKVTGYAGTGCAPFSKDRSSPGDCGHVAHTLKKGALVDVQDKDAEDFTEAAYCVSDDPNGGCYWVRAADLRIR